MILREAMEIMINEILSILGDHNPSIYLYGSVATGDFKLGWSDIDILVLTDREITEQQAEGLVHLRQRLQERYPENPYFRLFEGGMLSLDAFWRRKRKDGLLGDKGAANRRQLHIQQPQYGGSVGLRSCAIRIRYPS